MTKTSKPAHDAGILTMTTQDFSAALDAALARAIAHDGPDSARKNAALNAAAAALAGPRCNWGGLKAKSRFTTDAARTMAARTSPPVVLRPAPADTGPRIAQTLAFPEFGIERMDFSGEAKIRRLVSEALAEDQIGFVFVYNSQKWSKGRISFEKMTLTQGERESAGPGARNRDRILAAGSDIEDLMNAKGGLVDWINDAFDIHEGWTTLTIAATRAGILICDPNPAFLFHRTVDGESREMEVLPPLLFREEFGPLPDGLQISDDLRAAYGTPGADQAFTWAVSKRRLPAASTAADLRAAGIDLLDMLNPGLVAALMRCAEKIKAGHGTDPQHGIKIDEVVNRV